MRLADVFGSGMVLQRNKKICMFGEGDGNGKIEFCGSTVEFTSENGAFRVYLPEMEAGGPYTMTVTLNGETEILTDILVGDVYIAGGQSNMQVTVAETFDISPRDCENVRYFLEGHCGDKYKAGLDYYCKTPWQKATVEASMDFSAIAFEFACQLAERSGVPIGIVSCSQGASRVDSWTAPEIVEREEYQALMPEKHYDYEGYIFNKDCWLYRNKLLHIAHLSVCGVIFYQGESNTGHAEAKNYGKLFSYMAENWRELFDDPELPFYTVQIMPFHVPDSYANWSDLRAQQEWVSKNVKNTYLVTMMNTGEGKMIHPRRKKRVGEALANAVMKAKYGENVEYCGPIADSFDEIEDGIRITFSHADGLHFEGHCPNGMSTYNSAGTPETVNAEIDGNVLTLTWLKGVKMSCVTMGYENYPHHNLYNSSGYLASPFKYILK